MANQHSTAKAQFGVRIKHELFICMEKRASELGITTAEAAVRAFEDFTRHVELTSDDYMEIARRVKREEDRPYRKHNKQ